MRKLNLFLCIVLLAGVFLTAHPIAASSDTFSNAALVIRVVDKSGKAVQNLSGMLELGVSEDGDEPPSTALSGNGPSQSCTGVDGKLYFTDGADMLPKKGTLILTAYYDNSVYQRIPLNLSASSKEITVTWTGGMPPSKAPDSSTRRFSFRVLDENGNPVQGVSGKLEQSVNGISNTRSLSGTGYDSFASGEDGRLYIEMETGWEKDVQSREYKLLLYGYYDNSLSQKFRVTLPDPPKSYKLKWKKPLPPKEPLPQSTGIRIFIVDEKGNPVEGVELSRSPAPNKDGTVDDIEIIMGPSDKNGYIRWDDVKPGTYKLYGSGKNKYEVKMPNDKTMIDVTIVWKQ